jgi:hypothetical protein
MRRVRVEMWDDLVSDRYFVGHGTFARCLRCGFCMCAFGRGADSRSKCLERLQKNCPRHETNTYFVRTGWTFVGSSSDE